MTHQSPAGDLKSAPASEDAQRLFSTKILPLFQAKCLGCHGNEPNKLRGGLDLRTRVGLLRGGDSGQPALVPGAPEKSLLYLAATRQNADLSMPPKVSDRLTDQQLDFLKQWIAAGAPWPAAKKAAWVDPADGVTVATSDGRTPDWTNRKYRTEDLWAFQPIRRSATPTIAKPLGPIHNPIDAFIQEKLIAKGIGQTAAQADLATLLRRATFDLTGLPPTFEDIEAIARDAESAKRQAIYEKMIDRLLASSRYGEQMARHWLDVVRYADTSGFSNDFERPHAWRYRDYVIRSFNADKPFDRFIIEQLAGDEMAQDSKPRDERSDSRRSALEQQIAVGFLRMGPWEHTGMSVAAVTRQDFLDDVTHHVGVTFLGLGLRCCRCHDHKFDPLPTLEYYRLQAVFAPVQFAETPLPFLPAERATVDDGTRPGVEARLAAARAELQKYSAKQKAALADWLKERGYASLKEVPDADRPNQVRFGLTDAELTLQKMWKKRTEYYERERLRFEPYAFTVYNGSLRTDYTSNKLLNGLPALREGPAQPVHVLIGGALDSPAEEVSPGVVSALPALPFGSRLTDGLIPDSAQGRRLALARWIANPNNPQTARVIVNRVWQWHFGRGLVATPNNFGKMGARPTHPELLDWLTSWFIDNGWSIKKLHRLIMTSATYQQESGIRGQESASSPRMSAAIPGGVQTIDPDNRLLWRFPVRRLAAEEIRDALLAVSGELNLRMGGPGAFPEINWDVALQPRHVMGSPAPVYQPSPKPEQRHRRTLYCFRFRTLSDPLLEVFNRPGSETSCECRDQTTVAPQAMALFNSENSRNRAIALANRLEDGGGTLDAKIGRAFKLCYGRIPNPTETALCRQHVATMLDHHRAEVPVRTELPRTVRRKVIQEETGLEMTWDEPLDVMAGYQRDMMPWQVSAEVRALAELCLVLMNSNEFLYVR